MHGFIKKPITISFLGIDGSGKSTQSKDIASWLQTQNLSCVIIPFHTWVFSNFLKKRFSRYIDKDRSYTRGSPYVPTRFSIAAVVKPPIALVDNILLYMFSILRYRSYDVIIFDRFICSTFIKFKALNYHVDWFGFIWRNIRTDISLIFDLSPKKSIERQIARQDFYLYSINQLSSERKEYMKLSNYSSSKVFGSTNDYQEVNRNIKKYLKEVFIKYGFNIP